MESFIIPSIVVTAVTCYLIFKFVQRNKPDPKFVKLVDDLRDEIININRYNLEYLTKHVQEALSKETLINRSELNEKKSLIDQSLTAVKQELAHVQQHISAFEKDRENKFGQLSQQLQTNTETTKQLQETTNKISLALSNNKTRGQLGERMAEDLLRASGYIENVNYVKQKMIKPQCTIPDFSFLLPNEKWLHMDVKFPFTNYAKYLEAPDNEKHDYLKQFLKDVRKRIAELSDRGFVNDESVECAILFIPNDQIFGFIVENDPEIVDDAIGQKTVLCSPASLFAILAIIRQSCKWFSLPDSLKRVVDVMSKLESSQEEYDEELIDIIKLTKDLHRKVGHLQITRNNMLTVLEQIKNIAA